MFLNDLFSFFVVFFLSGVSGLNLYGIVNEYWFEELLIVDCDKSDCSYCRVMVV